MELTPYLPSLAWLRREPQALAAARRHPNRTLLADGLLLTVPVAGGGRRFRRTPFPGETFPLSDHGRWTHVHLGAIETLYSRTPYFPHYFPAVADILAASPQFMDQLNDSLMRFMLDAVHASELLPLMRQPARQIAEEARRLRKSVVPEVSFLDPLFRFGPEAIFLLAPTL